MQRDETRAALIYQHIETHLGKIEFTWREVLSEVVPIDLHLVPPQEQRPYYTLITSGMSYLPMTVPQGLEEIRFAELLICLPSEWPLTGDAFQDEANYWPIRWLKLLARLPHQHGAWLGSGHTVPNGDPAKPMGPNTQYCGMLVAPCIGFGDLFPVLESDSSPAILFYNLLPLYREEIDYKLRHGFEGLLKKWDGFEVTEVLNLNRPNTCR
jgi:hypothetical protein